MNAGNKCVWYFCVELGVVHNFHYISIPTKCAGEGMGLKISGRA